MSIELFGGGRTIIEGCRIIGGDDHGIELVGDSRCVIEGCRFADSGPTGGIEIVAENDDGHVGTLDIARRRALDYLHRLWRGIR